MSDLTVFHLLNTVGALLLRWCAKAKDGSMIKSKLLTIGEVSDRTRVPLATLRYWRHIGQGPPLFALGKRIVGYEAEVEAWIADQAATDRLASR
jgi:predicted DNA-binding transcriptional regulator AlpA